MRRADQPRLRCWPIRLKWRQPSIEAQSMRAFLIAFSLLLPVLASATPAPYYQWQSKADGTVICRQTSPGHGWELLNGQPFRDLNCSMPAGRIDRPNAVPGFYPQPGR